MKLLLSMTADSDNTINKTLTDSKPVTIHFKNNEDIDNPQIILSLANYDKDYNYCSIDVLGRSYFIRNHDIINNNFVRLYCELDSLETYKLDILKANSVITATGNPSYIDDGLPHLTTTETDKYTSDTTLPDKNNYILVTIGG